MALHIGLDDTDGRDGMCTTFIATELVRKLTKKYDLVGYPKLVRLNPNIPWKTRGNGALSLSIGRGRGKKFLVGCIGNERIFGFEKGGIVEISDELVELVKDTVEKNAAFEDPNTNPAFVISPKKPPRELYWSAVRSIVELSDAKRIAKRCGAERVTYKNGRGLIGALAATAWTPRDLTYEILVYREKMRWGTNRKVSAEDVRLMDKRFVSTFNSYDYENARAAITPNSPCPILFGIRGDEKGDLGPAMRTIKSEKKERWMIFRTNQGTDDHLVRKKVSEVRPYDSVIVKGTVTNIPKTIEGGHVIFKLQEDGFPIDAAAYEPSKKFRNVVRRLAPGDAIAIYGGVRASPRTINIEKMRIDKLTQLEKKVANPLCKKCKKRMKSVGKGKGYRCLKCGLKSSKAELKAVKRDLEESLYEPPVCARRHLSKPLKRMLKK